FIVVILKILNLLLFSTTPTTITVDGDLSEWESDEILATYGPNSFRVTWDANNFYFAMARGNAFPVSDTEYDVIWVYFDVSDGVGTTTSVDWSGTHTLPFNADWVYMVCSTRAVSDGGEYANLRYWDGSAWSPKNGDWNYGSNWWASNKTATYSGDRIEWYIPKAEIGFTSTNTLRIVLYVTNGDNNWLWGSSPNINETGPSGQIIRSYLDYGTNPGSDISPYDEKYIVSNLSLGAESVTVNAFSPVIDGIKELYWSSSPSATSTQAMKPNSETDFDTTTAIKPAWFDEVTEGLANDIYVTNDANFLYIGWKARGDPYEKETDNTEQPAHYEFLILRASYPAGGVYDPWKSGSDVRVINWGIKVWVNGYIGWQEDNFTGMTKYIFQNNSWDEGTTLTSGVDYYVNLSNKWGELKIPLSDIGAGKGEKIAIIHTARHSAVKPGFNDSTPFIQTAVSDWADSSSVIYSTNAYIYRIQEALITARHIPEEIPISGWNRMREPLNPSSSDSPEITVEITPDDANGTFYIKYSTDKFNTNSIKNFSSVKYSGGRKYLFYTIQPFKRNTTVKYYFELDPEGISGVKTYLAGGTTYFIKTKDELVARNNAFSYTILNSSPTSPTSIVINPELPDKNTDIIAETSGSTDSDDDPLSYIFEWYRNGVFFSSETILTPPFISTLSYTNTNIGEEWYCKVKVKDTLGFTSDYATSETVFVSSITWSISKFQRFNEVKIENDEVLIMDKTDEATDSYFDIEYLRMKISNNKLFLLSKLKHASSKDVYQFVLTVSTSNGGYDFIGDDSPVTAGSLFGEGTLWERMLIFHSTSTSSFTAELNDGNSWLSSNSKANFYEDSKILEVEIPTDEIGINKDITASFTFSVFRNNVGKAEDLDTTASTVLDCITISSFTLNDNNWNLTNFIEEIGDSKIDYFFSLNILSTGEILNQKPNSFSLITPSGTIQDLSPYFDWNDSSDPDGTITSYIIEIGTSPELDGNILYRVNLSTSEFNITENLEGHSTYYWRAGARDNSGEITFSTTWYFYINLSEPKCSPPKDDQNISNLGLINGEEDADGNLFFYWPPATDYVNVVEYEIRISSDINFNFVNSTATTQNLYYTFSNLPKGYIYYAQVRAKNENNVWGEWSDASDGIYVSRKYIDGSLSDWIVPQLQPNTTGLYNGDGFWQDKLNDQRTDKSNSSQLDISTFGITADKYNLYFYVVFNSTVGTFGDGRHFIELILDVDKTSSERVIIGRGVTSEDSYTGGENPWEYIIRIRSGQDDVAIIDNLFNTVSYGKYTENTSSYFLEGAVSFSDIGGDSKYLNNSINVILSVLENDGTGGVAQYAADNSNIVDLITSTGTWEEVQDQVIDYYLTVSFNEDG
ncbi:MAG: hypothetical protein DRI36_05165, partial [Caldiserica bacterium]